MRDKAYIIGIGCKGKLNVEKIKAQGIKGILNIRGAEYDGPADTLTVETLYGEKTVPYKDVYKRQELNRTASRAESGAMHCFCAVKCRRAAARAEAAADKQPSGRQTCRAGRLFCAPAAAQARF